MSKMSLLAFNVENSRCTQFGKLLWIKLYSHLLSDIEKWIQAVDFSVSIYQISQVAIDEFIDWSWTFFENELVDKTQN